MATIYKSKIDMWLALILIGAMIISLIAAVMVLSEGSPGAWWVALLTGGFGFVLPLIILVSTQYTIRDRELIVRSGPFKWRIPIADIKAVTPTSDPLSSPALSLDRLRIDYGEKKSLMISPRDKDGFLRELDTLRSGAV
jgi:hypothetical protein